MSWYKSMKPLRKNLKLFIKEYLYGMNGYLPGVQSPYNDDMLKVMSKYLLIFHCENVIYDIFND